MHNDIWRRPPALHDPVLHRVAELRLAARRFLQQRGRPAGREDVDHFLLVAWWRLPDDVHDRLHRLDSLARARSRRRRERAAGRMTRS